MFRSDLKEARSLRDDQTYLCLGKLLPNEVKRPMTFSISTHPSV